MNAPMRLGDIAQMAKRAGDVLGEQATTVACPTCRLPCRSWELKTSDRCGRCVTAEAFRKEAESSGSEAIPEKFRWADLEGPMVPPGGSESVIPMSARADALEWLAGNTQALFIGGRPTSKGTVPTGIGRTSLAAGLARVAIRHRWRVQWVRAATLGPVYSEQHHREVLEAVRTAGSAIVVVDGLGKELALAAPGSGVISQRVPAMQELMALVYELPKTRFALTSDITGQTISDVYGGDALRRIAKPPNARVILLGSGQ